MLRYENFFVYAVDEALRFQGKLGVHYIPGILVAQFVYSVFDFPLSDDELWDCMVVRDST